MASKKALERITWCEARFNRRTVRMLKWVEKKSGSPLRIAQGSFNKGGVRASAGTHDGSAVDIGTAHISKAQAEHILKWMKRAGFAAWLRTPNQGFDPHIHAIPFGDPDVSPSAAQQRKDFDAGLDGLAGRRKDPNPWRPRVKRSFSFRLRRPIPRRAAKK